MKSRALSGKKVPLASFQRWEIIGVGS